MSYQYFHGFFIINKYGKNYVYLMCTLFVNLYVLLKWGPHMVYQGTLYIFHIYLIRCGCLGNDLPYTVFDSGTMVVFKGGLVGLGWVGW